MIGFINETLTRTVYAAATYDFNTGLPKPGAATITTITGSLQPISDKERLILPEGDRITANKKFYTKTKLTISDKLVRSNGEIYEVIQVQEFTDYGQETDHYKCYLSKVEY